VTSNEETTESVDWCLPQDVRLGYCS
jgi:hypothetical protein